MNKTRLTHKQGFTFCCNFYEKKATPIVPTFSPITKLFSKKTLKFSQQQGLLLGLILLFSGFSFTASAQLNLTTDEPTAVYDVGEPINFQVTSSISGAVDYVITHSNDTEPITSGTVNVIANIPKNIPFTAAEPMAVFCEATQFGNTALAGASCAPFDIPALENEPADFDAFWNNQKTQLAAVPVDPQLTFYTSDTYTTTYRINLGNIDGRRVYGYISVPQGTGPFPAVLSLPAAGTVPNLTSPQNFMAERAGVLAVSVSIFNAEPDQTDPNGYNPNDPTTPEGNFYRYAILGTVRMIDYLFTRPDFDGENIGVMGVSQGGGLAMLVAGIDNRVKLLATSNPSHCQHAGFKYEKASPYPFYLRSLDPDVGGEQAAFDAAVSATRYYDAIFASRRFTGPSLTITNYRDDVNPSATVYAALNGLRGTKVIMHSRDLGHIHTGDYWDGRYDFLRKHFPATLNAPWPWTPTTTGYHADAGQDASTSTATPANLNGSVQKDNVEMTSFPVEWKVVSGSGNVFFENKNSRNTTASFSNEGIYRLAFIAYDNESLASEGKFYTSMDEVQITVTNGGVDPPSDVTITCPDNISVTAPSGQTEAQVSWLEPVATTTCNAQGAAVQQIGGLPSGSFFSEGLHVIEYEATDNCNNSSTCSFTITVEVETSSSNVSISCPGDVLVFVEAGQSGDLVSWQEPTATTTCPQQGVLVQQISGLSNGSFFPIGTTTIEYEATDNCNNMAICSFTITVEEQTPPNEITYCEAQGNSPWVEWIEGVNFAGINQFSGKDSYADFTDEVAAVNQNENYSITLTPGYSFTEFEEYWSVWIDFNQDGDFEDAGENVVSENGIGPIVTDINIPSSALLGTTRMRISMKRGSFAAPCETFSDGEVEDYSVHISEGAADTEAPTVVLSTPSTAVTGAFTVNVSFNEEVTGLNLADFAITNGIGTTFTGSGSEYVFSITPVVFGTVTIQLPANSVADLAGNGNLVSNLLSVEYSPSGNISLSCSNNITVTAEAGSNSAIVSWSTPTASTSCPIGTVSLTQIEGLAEGSSFPIGTTTITYEATDECDNIVTCSFEITVLPPQPTADYCESLGTAPWQEYIENVNFGDINNTSFKESYGDFIHLSTSVEQGSSNPISLTPGYSWTAYEEYWRVWIDFNQDGDFEDANEKVLEAVSNAPVQGTINIPSNATLGDTRMRISMKRGSFATSCETFTEGEVEDYTVSIQEGSGTGGGDTTPPSVDLSTVSNTVSGAFVVNVQFSEAITGLSIFDFIVGNGIASNLTGAVDTYSFTITPIQEGIVNVSLPANAVTDLSNNGNLASNALAVTYLILDTTAPTVTLSTIQDTINASFEVNVTFSEIVTGLESSDFVVTNGIATALTGNDANYLLTISPDIEGEVLILLPASAAFDETGNGNEESNLLVVEYKLSGGGDDDDDCVTIDLLPENWQVFNNGGVYNYDEQNDEVIYINVGKTFRGVELLFSDIGFEPNPNNAYILRLRIEDYISANHNLRFFLANGNSSNPVTNFNNISGDGTVEININLNGRDRFRIAGQGANNASFARATIEELEIRCIDNDDWSAPPVQMMSGNFSEETFNLFPNPVNQIAHLSYWGTMDKTLEIRLMDMMGKEIKNWEWNVQTGINEMDLDLGSLPKGIYWLNVNDGLNKEVKKIIKQ